MHCILWEIEKKDRDQSKDNNFSRTKTALLLDGNMSVLLCRYLYTFNFWHLDDEMLPRVQNVTILPKFLL